MTCYELGRIDSQSSFLLVACEIMKWDIDLRKDGKCSNGCVCVCRAYIESWKSSCSRVLARIWAGGSLSFTRRLPAVRCLGLIREKERRKEPNEKRNCSGQRQVGQDPWEVSAFPSAHREGTTEGK